MYRKELESVDSYLQKEDVRQRILQDIERARSEITVSIGRAAKLFSFSENQLRDWERQGILSPQRSDTSAQRRYTVDELDKLAVIRELLNASYTIRDIPRNTDQVVQALSSKRVQKETSLRSNESKSASFLIDQTLEDMKFSLFWPYFVSHALHKALIMIVEHLPHAKIGLVLPLDGSLLTASVRQREDLHVVGDSIVGWLNKGQYHQVLFISAPSLQLSPDHLLLPLAAMKDNELLENPKDSTLIIIDKRFRSVTLKTNVVETIRRLLALLYASSEALRAHFGQHMKEVSLVTTGVDSILDYHNVILAEFASVLASLGKTTPTGYATR